MRSALVALPLTVALLIALLSVGGSFAAGGSSPQLGDPVAPGTLVIEIQLQRHGDARFVVSTAYALENESDRQAFTDLGTEFENGNAKLGLGADTFVRASELASNATGRDMEVTGIDRTATVVNDTGVLRLSFTWTNFAETTSGKYRIGDAFNTSSGTWLSSLAADQSLVVRSPPGYYGVFAAPTGGPNGARIENGDLIWTGPASFEPGFIEVAFQPGERTPDTETPNGYPMAALFGTSVVGIGVLALGAYWWFVYRERQESEPGLGEVPPTEAEKGNGAAAGGPGTESADTDGGATATAGGNDVDTSLLSDEERVEHLLRQNDRRMKQATIVQETGWSNAKVSQLLSSMAEEERIQKLRIGRENLIALPDEDIGEVESE